jgi:hypothetical protein
MILVPWLFAGQLAGMLNAVLQVWITAAGVLISLPFTALASRGGADEVRARQLERLGVVVSIAACLALFLGAHLVVAVLSIPHSSADAWVQFLSVAVLFRVIARTFQYRLVAGGAFLQAALTYVPLSLSWLPLLWISDENLLPIHVIWAIAAGELLGLGCAVALHLYRRRAEATPQAPQASIAN